MNKKKRKQQKLLTFEEQRMITVIVGIGRPVNEMLEHLIDAAPGIIRHEKKKAFNDTVRYSEELQQRLFLGMDAESRLRMAMQVHDINTRFEEWIEETFNPRGELLGRPETYVDDSHRKQLVKLKYRNLKTKTQL